MPKDKHADFERGATRGEDLSAAHATLAREVGRNTNWRMTLSRFGNRLFAIATALLLAYLYGHDQLGTAPADKAAASAGNADGAVAQAVVHHQSQVAITGVGTVTKLLPDDNRGARHQRFLLRLPSGAVLLVAHNIDLAPRLEKLHSGDRVGFAGEFIWNERGGILHWTHRDPHQRHVDGWLEHDGQRYQ